MQPTSQKLNLYNTCRTTIISTTKSGHDQISGFNVAADTLVVQKISANVNIQITQANNGTLVKFNEQNSIFLRDIKSTLFHSAKIKIEEKYGQIVPQKISDIQIPQTDDSFYGIFNFFPEKFLLDLSRAFITGATVTFFASLSHDVLKKYKCTDKQIATVNLVLQALITLYSGSIISTTASGLVSFALSYVGVSPIYANFSGTVVGAGVSVVEDACFTSSTYLTSTIKIASSMAASSMGSFSILGLRRLALWANNKCTHVDSPVIIDPELGEELVEIHATEVVDSDINKGVENIDGADVQCEVDSLCHRATP